MKIAEIQKKAKKMGVKATGKKGDMIKRIQEAEGNNPCFGARSQCSQMDCCWRDDCLPKIVA